MGSRGRRFRKKEPFTTEAASLTRDGKGYAEPNERPTHIADLLIGESGVVEVKGRRKGVDEAQLVELDESTRSELRAEPPCEHYGMCGGCTLQHMKPDAQLRHKQRLLIEDFREHAGQVPPVILPPVLGPTEGYRRRSRLGVKYVEKKGGVLVGFRERDKRFVAQLRHCSILAPPVGDLIEPLSKLVDRLSIRSDIPQAEVTVGENTTIFILRVLKDPSDEDRELLSQFEDENGVRVYLQTGGPNTVVPLRGEDTPLVYSLPKYDVDYEFRPTDFVQVNAAINEKMVDLTIELAQIRPTDKVLDLFCGLGNLTLPLCRSAGEVVAVEFEEALIERANLNAKRNGIENVRYEQANLYKDWAQHTFPNSGPFDIVVVDPPRSGAEEVMKHMRELNPRTVVYVACGPQALARDSGELIRNQGYQLDCAGVMDMFPHTGHVESIAKFSRID